jgi:hypothetical protein
MKKGKIKFNENVHYSASEMNRYLGALCETHNESLKAIKENFVLVNKKLDNHTEILGRHSKILDSHSKTLESHTEMIGSLMENMEIVKGDISTIKGDLKKKVNYDDFLSLVRRVQKIESKI